MALNKKRASAAAAIVAAIIALLVLASIGLYSLLDTSEQTEIDSLKKRVSVLENEIENVSAPPAPANQNTSSGVNEESYEGWATYENTSTGYTIRYPDTWTFNEEYYEMEGKPVEYVVFISPENQYYVSIGLRKKGSETILSTRTGIGAGDMQAAGAISVLGEKVKRTEHVYKGQVKEYFYPEANSIFEAGEYQGYAEFAKMTAANTDNYNLKGNEEAAIAEKIISSLSVTAGQ